jgi:hypothetical protein
MDTILWIDDDGSIFNNKRKRRYPCKEGIEFLSKKTGVPVVDICLEYRDMCCKTCESIFKSYITLVCHGS